MLMHRDPRGPNESSSSLPMFKQLPHVEACHPDSFRLAIHASFWSIDAADAIGDRRDVGKLRGQAVTLEEIRPGLKLIVQMRIALRAGTANQTNDRAARHLLAF